MGLHKPVFAGGLYIPGNIFLAPVAGYTDRVFRGLCVASGADLTFTELVSSEALARNSAKTFRLVERAGEEKRYGIQLFGADPAVMGAAAAALRPFCPAVIDINAGCPVPKVVKTGAGAALMKTPVLLGKIAAAVKEAGSRFPDPPAVTVKIRSGWDAASLNYRECARIAREEGAAMVSIHARTRAQGYEGKAEWDHIAIVSRLLDIPVCGSGDLFTAEDARRMLSETGCAAVMFARGALGNPFVFEETRCLLEEKPYTPPSPEKRVMAALYHLRSLAAISGENTTCRAMRAHFCRYLAGLPHAAAIRERIVRAQTIREYEEASAPVLMPNAASPLPADTRQV
jgi:nifR3 family TIM-barrel protein